MSGHVLVGSGVLADGRSCSHPTTQRGPSDHPPWCDPRSVRAGSSHARHFGHQLHRTIARHYAPDGAARPRGRTLSPVIAACRLSRPRRGVYWSVLLNTDVPADVFTVMSTGSVALSWRGASVAVCEEATQGARCSGDPFGDRVDRADGLRWWGRPCIDRPDRAYVHRASVSKHRGEYNN
jgi:hypothetical protein